MLYFINLTQVANINPEFGANFHAGSELGDQLLAAVEDAFYGMRQTPDAALADVRAHVAAIEAGADPMSEYTATYGDYQLTLLPELEANVPWIVEALLEGRTERAQLV